MDLKRLKAQLLTSGIQQSNNALFQVIIQLIDALTNVSGSTGGSVTVDLTALTNKSYLTETNETAVLTASRQILAGSGINLDYSVPGKLTISLSADISGVGYWTPLTDGDAIEMDLISANGDAVMVFVPTP